MPSDHELTLTSHELFALPADTPATGPAFRVEVVRKDRPALYAVARLVIAYTNKKNRNHYGVFFQDERGTENALLYGGVFSTHAAEKELDGEEILRLITEGANNEILTRFWKSPEIPYGLALRSNGFGRVMTPGLLLDSASDFRWGGEQESQFFEWNTAAFHSFCEKLVESPSSELNYFFNWQKLSPEKKSTIVTRCECGDWKNMVQLFIWILQLASHHFGPYPAYYETESYWQFMHVDYRGTYPLISYMRRWQNTILSIIRPSFWPDEPLCRSKWRNRYTDVERDVTCSIPTAHEVVEAQLGLREFLRPYLSASEIEALFIP